jgi:5-methylcytosine-specific restriction enzyme A
VLAADGELKCEACDFLMDRTYHCLPADVFEVHHRLPLADAMAKVETRLEDLAILCANCHRAIHKSQPLIGVEAFRAQYIRR